MALWDLSHWGIWACMSLRVISPDSSSNSSYLQIEYRVLTFNELPLWNQETDVLLRVNTTPWVCKSENVALWKQSTTTIMTTLIIFKNTQCDHVWKWGRSVFVAYYLHWERVQSSTPSITSLNKKIETVEPDRYIGSLPYIALQKPLSVGLY